jgi:hypothetical protein
METEPRREYLPFRGVANDPVNYLPLDSTIKEIRYLTVEPDHENATLVCSLGRTTLDIAQVSYEALSYCWGSVDDTVEMVLRFPIAASSHSYIEQEFRITRNLDAALRALRLTQGPRRLWVDALCLNQTNPREKTHQVGLMSSIYQRAAEVIVWLGESDLHSHIFLRCWHLLDEIINPPPSPEYRRCVTGPDLIHSTRVGREFASQIQEDAILTRLLASVASAEARNSMRSHTRITRTQQFALSIAAFLRSFDQVLSRPWFRRIWVSPE